MPDPIASFSVANINPGSVRSEFMLSIMALVEQERMYQHTFDPAVPRVRFDKFYAQNSGPYLDDERNKCVQWFLSQTQSDYLIFIDSDIQFNPTDPFTLVETAASSEVTILTGVYYNSFYPNGLAALVHKWGDDPQLEQSNLLPLSVSDIHALNPPDIPHAVDACGAGFLAIHRSCLTDMFNTYGQPLPWFAELVLDGIHMGEDFTFCIRANYAGHPTYVLPSIGVTHYKTSALKPVPFPTSELDSLHNLKVISPSNHPSLQES